MKLSEFRDFLTGDSYKDPNAGPWWSKDYKPERRAAGGDWPATAFTMIGGIRLKHLQECVETVVRESVAGDLIECGIWRGGAVMLMRAALGPHTDRVVYGADSFQGLPKGEYLQDSGDKHHTFPHLRVSLNQVKANFAWASTLFGYDLSLGVQFLPGWFKDTLHSAAIKRLAILRLDGDMYGSTRECLTNLYPKVSTGGYVIVDDWGLPAARQAVEDYCGENKIDIFGGVFTPEYAYWRKL